METWERIRDFPQYEVNEEGQIRNIRTQRIIKTYINPERGYVQACLRKDRQRYTVKAAKLVMEAFEGEQPDMDIRYRDNDRSNIRLNNLYRSTRKETLNDSFNRGDRNPNHVTPVRVVETGKEYISVTECSRDTGCAKTEIHKQLAGRINHVKGYHFEKI